jgi:hypothetical protein
LREVLRKVPLRNVAIRFLCEPTYQETLIFYLNVLLELALREFD